MGKIVRIKSLYDRSVARVRPPAKCQNILLSLGIYKL